MKKNFVILFMIFIMQLSSLIAPSLEAEAARNDWIVPPQNECIDLANSNTDDEEEDDSDLSTGDSSTAPAGVEAWLTKGTQEYKNAKQVYDTFIKHGTSSAFALGVLANVRRESGFQADIKEIENGQNYAARGGGLFQITPPDGFLNSPYAKQGKSPWEVKNQTDYVWFANIQNRVIEPYINGSAGKAAGVGLYGIPEIKNVEELISTSDPMFATKYFYAGYERGADFAGDMVKSEGFLKQAKKVFETKVIKADKSKWKLTSGKTPSVSTGSDSLLLDDDELDGLKTGSSTDDDCGPIEKEVKGSGLFGLEGTGTHNYDNGTSWKPDDVPDDLKQYMLDPELVDMKYLSNKNWYDQGTVGENEAGSQCTHFASSLFARVWTKDGKTPIEEKESPYGACEYMGSKPNCNGEYLTAIWADHLKGSTSKEPRTGAIASVSKEKIKNKYGHVYMVSHVFENGDILTVEQNWSKSGLPAGLAYSWEYRIITKEDYKKDDTDFFRPDDLKPNEAYGTVGGGKDADLKKIPGGVKKVIAVAKSQMGKPYLQAHETSSGPDWPAWPHYDCSSLVQYAYGKGANINLSRTTFTQINEGSKVPIDKTKMKPGDLIFFDDRGRGPEHVALYLGDNKMIHAPNPSEPVKIDTVWGYYVPKNTIVGVRRLIK